MRFSPRMEAFPIFHNFSL